MVAQLASAIDAAASAAINIHFMIFSLGAAAQNEPRSTDGETQAMATRLASPDDRCDRCGMSIFLMIAVFLAVAAGAGGYVMRSRARDRRRAEARRRYGATVRTNWDARPKP
jgi:hypothetical protein